MPSPTAPSRDDQPRRLTGKDWQIDLLPSRPYATRYVATTDCIGFAFEAQAGEHAFGSDRLSAFRTRPNSLAFVPRGCEVISSSPTGGEYLVVRLTTPIAPDRQAHRFNDRVFTQAVSIAHRLRTAVLSGVAELTAVDELTAALQESTLCILAGVSPANEAERWMTPYRRATIEALIEDRLDQTLTISDLAGELGLSVGFFIRAFRAAFGRSPHAFLLDRRIARARRMMRDQQGRLVDIAIACGFSSHAHMTTVFKQYLGTTPAALSRMPNLCATDMSS